MLQRARDPSTRDAWVIVLVMLSSSALGVPFPPSMDVSELNGNNGFVINGADDIGVAGTTLSVDSAGDLNNDGFDDVVIGMMYARANGVTAAGKAYVVFGASSFPRLFNLRALDGNNGFALLGSDFFGWAGSDVSPAGDVNNDGIDDLLIGAHGIELPFPDQGQAYAVYGRESFLPKITLRDLDGSEGIIMNGIDADDEAGQAVDGAGDLNGDGIDDMLVGALGVDFFLGEVYVVFGGDALQANLDFADLDGSNGFTFKGVEQFDATGLSVSSAGDVNGDGLEDTIIGAPGIVGKPGKTYVVFGDAAFSDATFDLGSLDGTNGLTLLPSGIDGQMGFSVSGAGDVNGDGFDDIIVGGHQIDVVIFDQGEAYVVFGAPSFSATFDLATLDGTNGFKVTGDRDDQLGKSVAGVGDFNGDGFDDVLIGARLADPGLIFEAGESYLIFGAPSFEASVDLHALDGSNGFTLKGVGEDHRLGAAVGGAGDVNGDGYPDIIVGADGVDLGELENATQSYVVFGRSTAPLALAIDGECPGTVSVSIIEAMPEGSLAIMTAASEGMTTIPAGPCEGLEVGLLDPGFQLFQAGGEGKLVLEGDAPERACGKFVQVADITTCTVSSVEQVP